MGIEKRARQPQSFAQVAERTFTNRHIPVIRSRELRELSDYPIKATKPLLTKEAMTWCHTHYREYEAEYNKRVEIANREIDTYNARVDTYWTESGKYKFWEDHNTNFRDGRLKRPPKKQKKKEAHFRSCWHYNDHVREKNNEFLDHPVIKLERIQPLKEQHRTFFSALLWSYSSQLLKTLREKEKMSAPFYFRTVERVDVNLQRMLNLKHKNGHPMLLKRKGAYNDIKKRLEEAEVLQARGNRGHKRGVLYLIHPRIFAVYDAQAQYLTTLENQSLTGEETRKSWDIKTLTCPGNKPIVKGNVDKSPFPIRKKVAGATDNPPGPDADFLKGHSFASQNFTCTPSGMTKNPNPGPGKTCDVSRHPTSSTPEIPEAGPDGTTTPNPEVLQQRTHDHLSPVTGMPAGARSPIPKNQGSAGNFVAADTPTTKGTGDIHPTAGTPETKDLTRVEANSLQLQQMVQFPDDLARELSENKHQKSEPLPYYDLKMEAEKGTMDREDFRELLLQDLFKQFSKLYADHPYFEQIYRREWLKTYQLWVHSSALINPNGHQLHKITALQGYLKLLYVILDKRWGVLRPIQKKKFVPANPAIYLNPKNGTKGTFRYAYKHASENSEKVQKGIRRLLKIQKEAADKALLYERHLPRLTKQMARYKNGRITERELLDYVQFEMPKDVQLNFHKHWENFIINHKSKSK